MSWTRKGEDGLRAPSYVRMVEWASTELEEVKAELIQSRLNEARMDFAEESEEGEQTEDTSWMTDLRTDKGMILAIAPKLHPYISQRPETQRPFQIQRVHLSGGYVTATVPWRRITTWGDHIRCGYGGTAFLLESVYGMYAPQKLDDAFTRAAGELLPPCGTT